jgi:hypothetical protein
MNWRSTEYRNEALSRLSTNQSKRFIKLYSEEFYLLDYHDETFFISGSQRTVYKLKYYSGERKLFCNCPDNLVHCQKQGTVCKHICFLLIRVFKMYNLDYFCGTHQIANEMNDELLAKQEELNQQFFSHRESGSSSTANMNDNDAIQYIDTVTNESSLQFANHVIATTTANERRRKNNNDQEVVTAAVVEVVNNSMFCMHRTVEEICNDDCIICYDIIGTDKELVECPDCHNILHKQCIEKWLLSKNNCIFCRSDIWRRYKI